MKVTAVLLAAGQGTRMHSALPKVLHPLLGKPLIYYALETLHEVTGEKPIVVLGHEAHLIRAELGSDAECVFQEPQLGTGHAVLMSESLLQDKTDLVLVTYADMPLLTSNTLLSLIQSQQSNPGPITMLTLIADDPRGFGRVVRDQHGAVQGIVEEAEATTEQLVLYELNAGAYCFRADWLWGALRQVPLSPKGEYYLTDLVGLAVTEGHNVQAIVVDDPGEAIGINNRIHLVEAEAILRRRINRRWMLAGVTIIDPERTYIEPRVSIGQDTVIWPNTYLHGKTSIGEACVLGPDSIIRDSQVGNNCRVLVSVVEKAEIEDQVEIGPYCHLRKGAHLAVGVHIGNFGEIKNSYLGPGTKMGHFSYVGDAIIGRQVNIGAGTITCNFDGVRKHTTEIGEGAFIGSDTMLIAPVKIGERGRTGAGSVVTRDVPPDTTVAGVPARAIRKRERRD